MKCHYEILNISMKATDDEIKRSYRTMALKWHPDKNLDNTEECTKQFNLIQQAYDVLIDPQERAWYDRHRDAILKGGVDEHYEDNSLNLFAYFVSSCYSGFGDDEKGFYTVYRTLFETLVNEDAPFMDDQENEIKRIPTFGDSKSSYDEIVGRFYGHWQSYCTTKTYAWLDKYDIRQAPNRQVLRAMEKENKKIREAARKERNEEVRELVAFVRKRDRRVQAYRRVLDEQRLSQLKKVEEHRRVQLQNRLKELGEYKDADWHDSKAREDALKDIEAELGREFGDATSSSAGEESENDGKSDGELDNDSLYCPACEKAFKTPKAYKNHENSKKHKDGVKLLKQHMTEEEFQSLSLDTKGGGGAANDDDDNEDEQTTKASGGGGRKGKKSKRKQKETRKLDSDGSTDEEIEVVEKPVEPAVDDLPDVKRVAEQQEPVADERKDEKTKRTQSTGESDGGGAVEPKPASCQTCQESFPSRSKLFAHLKETGHASLKEHPTGGGRSAAKKAAAKKGKRTR